MLMCGEMVPPSGMRHHGELEERAEQNAGLQQRPASSDPFPPLRTPTGKARVPSAAYTLVKALVQLA